MGKVNILHEITVGNLITFILDDLDPDEIVEFIKNLDLGMASWDHTLELYEHFCKVKKEFDVESDNYI